MRITEFTHLRVDNTKYTNGREPGLLIAVSALVVYGW